MAEPLIAGLAVLGLIAPLLPAWRPALIATAAFAIADGALLVELYTFIAAEPNPGPGARMGVLIALAPTAAFVLGCLLRALFVLARCALQRFRTRADTVAKGN